MNRLLMLVALCCLSLTARAADDPANVIFDMDTVRHKPTEFTNKAKQKVPAGTAELVDGRVGKAVKFTFAEGASGGYMAANVRPTPAWDAADGFSFWVKGDGSDSFGGIEVIDKSDFSKRYGYCFPIDSTDWRKVTVRWGDLVPELAAPLVDAKAGQKPSSFGNFWFGKFYYYREYPAHAFTVDHVALEPKIDAGPMPAFEPGLARLRAKLAAKQQVTIVTMGDSLTDPRHWANRKTVWPQLLAQAIEAKYGSKVTIVNPAIGGTTLSQNVILIPRWATKQASKPDLVTVWFGGNDWDNKVRGPQFADYARLAVEKVRRATGGHADVLLMTTAPAHARWETYRELEDAAKAVAKEAGAAVVDAAGEFRKLPGADEALKQGYWVDDKVHLGAKGHELARDAVMRAIE